MDLVFTVVGWLSIPLVLGSALFLVRQWHRDQRLTTWRLAQPVVLASISLWFYVLVLGVPLEAITNWLPLVAGGAVGVLVSRGEDLRIERDEAVSTRTAWSYVVWATGLALSQGVALLAPGSAATGMAVVFATTGLTSGEHLGLLQRRYLLRHSRPVGLGPATAAVVLLVGLGVATASTGPASAQDAPTITEVAEGAVDDLSVDIRGSGLTYKGDAIELHFDNATGTTQQVHVPIGTELVPDDPAIQTMFTAGDEVLPIPPGESSELIRAFCGEKDDAAPGTGTVFDAHEPDRYSDEVATLERARDLFEDAEVSDDDIQDGLWEITDDQDNSLNPRAQEISTRNTTPSPQERGQAGLLGATPSAVAAGLLQRRRRGDGLREPGEGPSEGPWPGEALVDEHGELIHPDADGLYDQYVDGEWRKVPRDEAIELIRDARYWDQVNELERRRALEDHEAWSDRAWDDFVEDCRARAAADRARAAADAAHRKWRLDTADRLETVAIRNGYWDMVRWLGKDDNALPTADQLLKLREFLGRRMSDDRAMSAYFDRETDLEFFARGMHDDVAWVARQAGNVMAGPGGGAVAEWLVRNPEVPVRIALAVGSKGVSEVYFANRDIHRGLHAAADAKMAEQNLDLTSGEMAWEVVKVGLWELGGRVGVDVVSSVLSGHGVRGAYTGILGGVDETAEAAARATTRRGADETADRFVQRVRDRLAGRTARHTNLEMRMRFPDGSRTPPSGGDFIKDHLRQGDEILPHHWHETGLTATQMRNTARICQEEGVEALARTVDAHSMRHIRDGTGLAKPPFVQSAVITEADQYLNPAIRSGDEGLTGFFRPTRPDLSTVPTHLHDDVMRQFADRAEEYARLRPQIDDLVSQGRVVERDGKLFDALTGKPYVADCDLVAFRDLSTGRVIGPGPRYEHLKGRWINEVGGTHGASVNIVEDLTAGLRPGTPEYQEALQAALEKQAILQAKHTAGQRVVVQMGPDGVLRRGPVGADIDLYPDVDDAMRTAARPAPDVPIAPPTPTTPATPEWPLVSNRPAPPAPSAGAGDDVAERILRGERPPGTAVADELEVIGDQTFKGSGHAGQAGWSAEALAREETFWSAGGTRIPGVSAVDVQPPPKGFNIQYNARTGQATPRLGSAVTQAERQRLLRPGGPVDQAIERIRRTLGSPPEQ